MADHPEQSDSQMPFDKATDEWNLERLYRELGKQQYPGKSCKDLGESYQIVLQGLLMGVGQKQIASRIDSKAKDKHGAVRELASHLYAWIEDLTGNKTESKTIRDVLKDYRKMVSWFPPPPEAKPFYGREQDLEALTQWIVGNQCRLIVLFGAGGIGKTWLVSQLASQIAPKFEGGSWQHLDGVPSLEEVLTRSQSALPGNSAAKLHGIESRMDELVNFLRDRRYLLVFDGIQEELLNDHDKWPDYLRLFQRLEAVDLKGCVVLTSREKLLGLRQLDSKLANNKFGKVRSRKLCDLEAPAAEQLLAGWELSDRDRWRDLIRACSGNPLYLNVIAPVIQDHCKGNVSQFLSLDTVYLGEFEQILQNAWNYLGDDEKTILRRLAETSEPISPKNIREVFPEYSTSMLISIFDRLKNKCLIETSQQSDLVFYNLRADVRKIVSR